MKLNKQKNFYEYNEFLRLGKELFNLCYKLEEHGGAIYTKIKVDADSKPYLDETAGYDARVNSPEQMKKVMKKIKSKVSNWVGGKPEHKPL